MNRSQIIKLQQRYLSFLPLVRQQYGNLPGVRLIGLGAKEKQGKIVEEMAFRFYIEKKLPLRAIPENERIPEQVFGLQTDVLPYFETESLVCDAAALAVNNNEYRDSGIRGGISIRSEHFDNDHPSGYGTLGILARQKNDNALVGLTCAHVVNAISQSPTTLNIKIGQPKYWISCCCCPRGYIGDVTKATFNDDLDCALIKIHDDIRDKVANNSTENKVEGIAADIGGASLAVVLDNVQKYGRATGLTTGRVVDIAFGFDQMLVERDSPGPFACHGDSGAVIVDSNNRVIGLLVAAAQLNDPAGVKQPLTRVIATHIKSVMVDLNITIAGTDPDNMGVPGIEFLVREGGYPNTADNETEVFTSAQFGLSGPIDWDVSGPGTSVFIVETGGTTATGRDSITVRYDEVGLVGIEGINPATRESTLSLRSVRNAEWEIRAGGYPDTEENQVEEFNVADFDIGDGEFNWDVSTGPVGAIIFEADNDTIPPSVTHERARKIKVRYFAASVGNNRSQSVKIQATNPGNNKSWFNRRTVVRAEWAAWPGGQADTALNPTENFSAADMGFPAGTLLNWDVGRSTTDGIIVGAGGTTSDGVASIEVRYDVRSNNIGVENAVHIEATNPVDGTAALKLRTIFAVTPETANTSNNLHGLGRVGDDAAANGRNDLRFPATHGSVTRAGVVDVTMAGVTSVGSKMEQVFTIAPTSIPWSRRLVSFVFDDGVSVPQITGVKFECSANRDRRFVGLLQANAGDDRFIPVISGGGLGNDATFLNDGSADSGDAQYPTDAMPNHIFRIDSPGGSGILNRISFRVDFSEFIQFMNGVDWIRITPYSHWFNNITWVAGAPVAPNTAGSGLGAVNMDNVSPVINAGPDQAVAVGDLVTMNATYNDTEPDAQHGDFVWTQTAGPPVALAGASPFATVNFTPTVAGTYAFTVHADDATVILNSYNPGNSRGSDTINIVAN